ncbi:hypothetical protein LINGRAHAP2_LOCUS22968, partial [Linum grandiflorum]
QLTSSFSFYFKQKNLLPFLSCRKSAVILDGGGSDNDTDDGGSYNDTDDGGS